MKKYLHVWLFETFLDILMRHEQFLYKTFVNFIITFVITRIFHEPLHPQVSTFQTFLKLVGAYTNKYQFIIQVREKKHFFSKWASEMLGSWSVPALIYVRHSSVRVQLEKLKIKLIQCDFGVCPLVCSIFSATIIIPILLSYYLFLVKTSENIKQFEIKYLKYTLIIS